MKIYDLSKEVFTAAVFPGDPAPSHQPVLELSKGDGCNLTALTLGSHTGTHMDAPSHFVPGGKTIDQVDDIAIDQVVIGSCTNGRMDDMRIAAEILKGRKVKKGIRCIVIPATQAIYLQSMREGLLETFIEAGAIVSTPTCGPCLGGYMGILAAGERCVSTTNRNFVGRMGHVDSEIYLASPAVAAASAVTGKISGPEELGL